MSWAAPPEEDIHLSTSLASYLDSKPPLLSLHTHSYFFSVPQSLCFLWNLYIIISMLTYPIFLSIAFNSTYYLQLVFKI